MRIKLSLSVFLFLVPAPAYSELIVWDLGDTLVGVSIFGMVCEIGITNCIKYHLFYTREKDQLQNRMFDVLEEYGGKQTGPAAEKSYHTAHRPLPQIMCDWLAGKILAPKDLAKKIHKKMKQLKKEHYFKNDLEYEVVKSAITAMFNPDVLIKNTKVLHEALKIVEEIALKGAHQQTILSNWDAVSYENFKASITGQELSRYFNMNDIIISGSLNLIKPQQAIFDQCLERYKLQPHECIFIDDQLENVEAARRYGFKAIQIKNHDFKQLRKDLILMGVL